jgi:hypothetical protein
MPPALSSIRPRIPTPEPADSRRRRPVDGLRKHTGLLSEQSVNYSDLEDPVSLARLEEPMTTLQPLRGRHSVVADITFATVPTPVDGATWSQLKVLYR